MTDHPPRDPAWLERAREWIIQQSSPRSIAGWLARGHAESLATLLAAVDTAAREDGAEIKRAARDFLDQCFGPMRDGGSVGEWSRRYDALAALLGAPTNGERERALRRDRG